MFSNARAALTYRQESPAKKHFRRKQREIILFVLSCRVFRLQIGLCKEKKRKLKTVGVSMKPRNYVKKLNEFISGNKRLNCCGKRVK